MTPNILILFTFTALLAEVLVAERTTLLVNSTVNVQINRAAAKDVDLTEHDDVNHAGAIDVDRFGHIRVHRKSRPASSVDLARTRAPGYILGNGQPLLGMFERHKSGKAPRTNNLQTVLEFTNDLPRNEVQCSKILDSAAWWACPEGTKYYTDFCVCDGPEPQCAWGESCYDYPTEWLKTLGAPSEAKITKYIEQYMDGKNLTYRVQENMLKMRAFLNTQDPTEKPEKPKKQRTLEIENFLAANVKLVHMQVRRCWYIARDNDTATQEKVKAVLIALRSYYDVLQSKPKQKEELPAWFEERDAKRRNLAETSNSAVLTMNWGIKLRDSLQSAQGILFQWTDPATERHLDKHG